MLFRSVRKMTSATASQFGLTGRGVLLPGAIADVTVFDPATVGHADGSPTTPFARPTGIPFVVLAGHVVIDGGVFTGERLGRVLRSGHPEPASPARAAAPAARDSSPATGGAAPPPAAPIERNHR